MVEPFLTKKAVDQGLVTQGRALGLQDPQVYEPSRRHKAPPASTDGASSGTESKLAEGELSLGDLTSFGDVGP